MVHSGSLDGFKSTKHTTAVKPSPAKSPSPAGKSPLAKSPKSPVLKSPSKPIKKAETTIIAQASKSSIEDEEYNDDFD